jgi:hypothetical protein
VSCCIMGFKPALICFILLFFKDYIRMFDVSFLGCRDTLFPTRTSSTAHFACSCLTRPGSLVAEAC